MVSNLFQVWFGFRNQIFFRYIFNEVSEGCFIFAFDLLYYVSRRVSLWVAPACLIDRNRSADAFCHEADACRRCSGPVVQAHAPEHVVPGGLPTEALIAQVIVSKFGDHLPFYRQPGIYKRQGIALDRATLGNWVGRACFHLKPIVEQMRSHLKAADRIFMDETRAPALDPGRKRTKTGWFWAIVSDDRGHGGTGPPVVMFHHAPGRGGVQAILTRVFNDVGLPDEIRSDNGSPFGSIGAGGLSRLSVWFLKLGIEVRHITPSSPQDNARHELMHRTLKAETARPPADRWERQRVRFNRFRQRYNEERPHEALGQTVPASCWSPPRRTMPAAIKEP